MTAPDGGWDAEQLTALPSPAVVAAQQNISFVLDALWQGTAPERDIIARLRDTIALLGGTWEPSEWIQEDRR